MHNTMTVLALLAFLVTAPYVMAQTETPEAEQDQVYQAQADAAYDRGAYYFTHNIVDHPWPLLSVNVEGQPSLMVYDTGVSEVFLFRELFDLTPAEEQRSYKIDIQNRSLEPVTIQLFEGDNGFEAEWVSDIPWASIGYPDYVKPFISGLIAPLHYGGKTAAFERNPQENWFALFKSPYDPDFKNPVNIKIETVFKEVELVDLKVRLPGANDFQTLRLWIDTGHSGDLELKSHLFSLEALEATPETFSYSGAGKNSSRYVEGVTVLIGEKTLELNSVSSSADLPTISKEVELDGIIGSQFLNRFHHVIDVEAGVLILELDGADLTPSSAYTSGIPATVPFPDWNGAVIIDPEDWAERHDVLEADIIYSVNGEDIVPHKYLTMIRQAIDTTTSNEVCIFRRKHENTEGKVFCFDTEPTTSPQEADE